MTDLVLPPFGRLAWIDVVLLVWFALTAISLAYVAWDAYREPAKWLLHCHINHPPPTTT